MSGQQRTISRRTGLEIMGTGALGIANGFAPSAHAADTGGTGADAFALIGDRYHNSDYIRTALTRTLVRDSGVTIDFTDDYTLLSTETLRRYRMLIIFRDGMIWPDGYLGSYPGYSPRNNEPPASDPPLTDIGGDPEPWITPEQGRAVRDFVEQGGSALFYHNAGHLSLYNDDYRDVEGATFIGHPAVREFRVHIADTSHPITRGVNDFLVTDEQHYLTYHKSPEHVLITSESTDGTGYRDLGPRCEAGWAYDYGRGRVCFLAPGHMISVLWNPEYVTLQQNAAKWLLRRD